MWKRKPEFLFQGLAAILFTCKQKSFNVDMVTVTSGFEQWTDNGSSDSDKGLVDAEMQ